MRDECPPGQFASVHLNENACRNQTEEITMRHGMQRFGEPFEKSLENLCCVLQLSRVY